MYGTFTDKDGHIGRLLLVAISFYLTDVQYMTVGGNQCPASMFEMFDLA